ncbi:hypothetical protein FRC12_017724 [Ceratobasidium sp. 428]|nr:hypothetical protein FRC12_017724 [Ceratobasidium sp. 428]
MSRRSLRLKSASSSLEQPALSRQSNERRATRSTVPSTCPVESMDASLEFRDVTVTIANPSEINDEHNALRGFKYNERLEDDEDAVCWVAVPPSRRFCVHVAYTGVSPPTPDAGLNCDVKIEGIGPICGAFLTPESISKAVAQRIDNKPVIDGEVEIVGCELEDDNTMIRPLRFFERPTTDSDENIPPPNLDQFGIVEVLVGWSAGHANVKTTQPDRDSDIELLTKPVDEKLKNVQYRYVGGVGPAEYNLGSDTWNFYDTMPIQDEVFVFHFKYRDLG